MQVHLVSVTLALAVILSPAQSDEVYCGDPPIIEFAEPEGSPTEQYSVGTTVRYTCDFGYTTKGKSNTLECKVSESGEEADWSTRQFSCTPQSCGDPGSINNGRRIGSLFTFPDSVKYECNEGYKLKGLSTRYCQASGTWSGRLPECEEISCPPPRNLENGFVSFSTLTYGSELNYKCDKGFHLNTEETVFCTSEGKWSDTNVQCMESVCAMLEQPKYGSMQIRGSEKLLAGTLALFSCDDNRIADGPLTSKCLETGEWTFPPPKCLEPCQIPRLTHGMIGKYVKDRYSRRRDFKEVTVGYKTQDEDVLYIRCPEGYQVLGLDKTEKSVSCKLGKWSHELQCEPAFCRSRPPPAKNAQAVSLNPEHGGEVLYLCDEGFIKSFNETIVCHFGIWTGALPVCKNVRCSVHDLKFPGLMKGRKSLYLPGEVLEIECDSGYQVPNAIRRELRCEDGNWKGLMPPCVAASCTQPPPNIDHGEAEVHSTVHSSTVKYTCRDPYTLRTNSRVHCLFGKWEGQPPTCEDSRCYLQNLQNSAYVDFDETESLTLSGNKLHVICKEGYSPKSQKPFCLNGKWSGNSFSPCEEKNCKIPILYHGDMIEIRLGNTYWSWRSFAYKRDEIHEKIPAGTMKPYGSSLTLFCYEGYYFQGTTVKRQRITCSQGTWRPNPVCLLFGQKYVPQTTTRKPYRTSLTKVTEPSTTVTTSTKPSEIFVTTTHAVASDENDKTPPPTAERPTFNVELSDEKCYCEYPIEDENLIAHAEGKRLKFHDKVQNGSLVVFRCKHIGYHRLHGMQTIKCEECGKWHSSEFPTCSKPQPGNAVIIFDDTVNVSIEGNLEAKKGQDVNLMCVAAESGQYPHWTPPNENGVTIKRERMERESYGDVLYISHLEIEDADIENEGPYGCALENNPMNTINLVIKDPNLRCPEFPEVDGVSIRYDMEGRINSKALFSCTRPNEEIDGHAVLTCQRDGEWSDAFPQCTTIRCRQLKENDLLVISYTNNRIVGSKATFHCFAPGQRLGASFADCLDNATWSNATPTCTTPPCAVEDIYSYLPDNVVLDRYDMNKTVPYNGTIKLTCAKDMIVEGEPVAKCNREGKWVTEDIRCVSGCPELTKDPDSNLIITPHKDVYKLGDMVTFMCPLGMKLTTQSQLIMCLKYGWSETILPDCQ